MAHTLEEIKVILNDNAKSLLFNLTQKEEDDLFKMFESIIGVLNMIKDFEIPSDIKPSDFPDNQRFVIEMREDEPCDLHLHTLDIFSNTKEFRNNMVVLNNVKK